MKALIDVINTSDGKFHGRNIQTGELATIFTPVYANDNQDALRSTQRELLSVLSAADIKPDEGLNNQLLAALKKLLMASDELRVKNALQIDQNLDDVKDKATACKNLGLKKAAFCDVGTTKETVAAGDDPRFLEYVPVGSPIPWPTDIPPPDFTIIQGQTFDKIKYPKLGRAYPTGVLPDMRGETIKGKPAAGRTVLSPEQDGIRSHNHAASVTNTDLGRKTTNVFDYGSKPTTAFDHGNRGTDGQGNHAHNYTRFVEGINQYHISMDDVRFGYQGAGTDVQGNHGHTVFIGAHNHLVGIGGHNHFIDMGAHGHTVTVNAAGNAENTVRNIAFNYIVRLA